MALGKSFFLSLLFSLDFKLFNSVCSSFAASTAPLYPVHFLQFNDGVNTNGPVVDRVCAPFIDMYDAVVISFKSCAMNPTSPSCTTLPSASSKSYCIGLSF